MEHHKLLVFRVSPGERVLRIGHGRVWVPRCGPGDRALGKSPELCWIQTRPSRQEPTVQTPVDPSMGGRLWPHLLPTPLLTQLQGWGMVDGPKAEDKKQRRCQLDRAVPGSFCLSLCLRASIQMCVSRAGFSPSKRHLPSLNS